MKVPIERISIGSVITVTGFTQRFLILNISKNNKIKVRNLVTKEVEEFTLSTEAEVYLSATEAKTLAEQYVQDAMDSYGMIL
ncbi:MAG: hypothetical protein Q7R99_01855 [bacterium]|nr:hypothetical protein [bacterium]